MKRVEVIVKPFRVQEIAAALHELGLDSMTVFSVEGLGRRRELRGSSGDGDDEEAFHPQALIAIYVSDAHLQRVLDTILDAARTGKYDDGKISVSNLEQVIRIRTGETGDKAL